MEKLWDKVKKSLTESYNVAAEKTEELTKMGKLKIDILNTKRKISKQFTELGGIVYEASKNGITDQIMSDLEVVTIINSLATLEEELMEKENSYEGMKNTMKEKAEHTKEKVV